MTKPRSRPRRRSKLILGAILLILISLGMPGDWPLGLTAATDTPTAASVCGGETYARSPASASGGIRHFRVGVVSDATSTTCTHRAAWDNTADGAAQQYTFTVTFRTWTTGTLPPALPDADGTDSCRFDVMVDDGATVHSTPFNAATCPADASTSTITIDHPGTWRLRFRVVQSNELGDNYNLDTDSTANSYKGALRTPMYVDGGSQFFRVTAQPAGGFAFGDSILFRVNTHTPYTGTGAHDVRFGLSTTPGGAPELTQTVTPATGTGTSNVAIETTFTVSDTFAAASQTYHMRFEAVSNSPLSGVKWTTITRQPSSQLVALDGEFAAYGTGGSAQAALVDPRVTATHLLLVDDSTMASPPMSENDPDDTRQSDEIGRIATRFTNARGEGLTAAGFTFTSSIQDSTPIVVDTATGLTVGTQGGQAGWSDLRLWNYGAPLGQWAKTVDITAPATIDDATHLIQGTKMYTLESPTPPDNDGGHFSLSVSRNRAYPGEEVQFAASQSYMDGTARTGNAAGTLFYLYNPSGVAVLNGVTGTEPDRPGIYTKSHVLATDAPHGNWRVVAETTDTASGAPITVAATFTVDHNTTAHFDALIQALVLGNITVYDQYGGWILENITDHRNGTIELASMNDFDNLGFDGTVLIFVWMTALIWCLRNAKLLAAGIATIGVLVTLIKWEPGLQALAILLFGIALWLEATLRDRIYSRWFGESGRGGTREP